jgi:putative ABC transport system permease protein
MSDIRFAIRTFLRTPGFTIVAVLTLALGIGATTAIFSVVNAVLLKPLPYADAERLVTTRGSLPDLRDLREAARTLDAAGFWASNLFNLKIGTDSRQDLGAMVSRDLVPLLGVQPAIGRTFTVDDDRQDTVMLSHGLWQSRFGGDPNVVGRTVDLSGTTFTIIGVAPSSFHFPSAEFQVWAPLSGIDIKNPAQARNRAFRIFTAVARLKSGATIEQARAEAQGVSARLAREYPSTNEGVAFRIVPLFESIVSDARPALAVLFGTVSLLLLIACANVANLMLARATVRERELAIRVALGAGRPRLVRQLLVESLTLAVAGGFLGLLVTLWGIDLLAAALQQRLPRAEGIHVDGVVLGFTACAIVVTGLFFGVAPALQSTRAPDGSLKESGRGVAGSVRGRRLRRAIVIGETALAVVVLVGAGLLVRSFLTLVGRDAGFSPSRLVSFNVQFVALRDETARLQAAAALMDRLAELPGVEAGAATGFPSVTPQRGTRFAVEGRTLSPDEDGAFFIATTPGYFSTLRTPIMQGRAIDRRDAAGAVPVVVINRTLERQLFPGGDAVGQRLKIINPEQSAEWRTIVGVAGDVAYRGLDQTIQPTIYTPFAQTPFLWLYVMVRSPGDFESIARTLQSTVPSVHPSLTAASIRPMTDVMAQGVAEPRFNMLLVSGFAALALVLSSIGIYGVIAYSVAQRTHEIGVRMALGAARRDVLGLVLADGLRISVAGVLLGVAASLALTRVMASLLVGVSPRDPLALALGAGLLLTVAIAASYVPALRASRVDPSRALRSQ